MQEEQSLAPRIPRGHHCTSMMFLLLKKIVLSGTLPLLIEQCVVDPCVEGKPSIDANVGQQRGRLAASRVVKQALRSLCEEFPKS